MALGVMPDISLDEAEILNSLLVAYREYEGMQREDGVTDIEDLHNLISDQRTFEAIEALTPSTVRAAKHILRIPTRGKRGASRSAILEAAMTKSIRVRGDLLCRTSLNWNTR